MFAASVPKFEFKCVTSPKKKIRVWEVARLTLFITSPPNKNRRKRKLRKQQERKVDPKRESLPAPARTKIPE